MDNAADDLADALEDAQAAHEADDKEARDRAVERAKDAADVINNNIGGDVGKRVQRDVQANRNRFDADDNQVEPMDRDEGNKKVADALAAEQDKLRKEGREGRKKARDLRDEIEGFEEAIDMAEQRRTDEKGREAYIKTAQGVIDGVAKNNPELAEVMQEVLDGQAARVRQAPEVVDTAGDAYRRKGRPRRGLPHL